MSLIIRVKHLQAPKCKGEKLLKAHFRGSTYTKLLDDNGDELFIVNERHEWHLDRAADDFEFLSIELCTKTRLFGDKLLGSYSLILQSVIKNGKISVNDCLVDNENKPVPVNIQFDLLYSAPDESMISFTESRDMGFIDMDESKELLSDFEKSITNYERSISQNSKRSNKNHKGETGGGSDVDDKKSDKGSAKVDFRRDKSYKKHTSAFRNVRNLIRLGKQRIPKSNEDDDQSTLLDSESGRNSRQSDVSTISRAGSETSLSSNNDSDNHLEDYNNSADKKFKSAIAEGSKQVKSRQNCQQPLLQAQDFQICITIIEARQLAGLNMDPIVCIQVGDQKKYTSVKESTNCPYYNEYFVFDFHMPPIMLLDKIITLSVMQSRSILRGNKLLGSFKLDVATVWAQPEHQFFHKWALLTDPDDITGGPKGYLKCDISVIGKGDSIKIPQKSSEKDDEDIEANLLMPDGVTVDRQRAKFIIKIYRADGLPKMNSSLISNMKKVFTGEVNDLVDPYVQVSFAGLKGRTSVKKNCYAPVWNEQLVFTEMFPPLCQRIKIQLRDNNPVKPSIIGTHFIDLRQVSNDGEKGFLPTYGPCFVHLYGSTRDYSLMNELSILNDGIGEGVSYRARLLIAIRTEISDNYDLVSTSVEMEPTVAVNEGCYGKNEDFFMFASILDATMLEKKTSDKPVYFEVSIGNDGNVIDGQNASTKTNFRGSESELETIRVDCTNWQSTTSPVKPMTHDRVHYFMPYWDNKPCMHISSVWPDYRRRMYNSNILWKIADKLEEGLSEVNTLMDREHPNAESHLKQILDDLINHCNKYASITESGSTGPGTGKTKLDKERMKLCQRELTQIASQCSQLRYPTGKNTLQDRYKVVQGFHAKIKFLVDDPQHALPDVFLWVISGGKRYAYHRIPARDLLFSLVAEECGKDCGKIQTIFLKLPGKKTFGSNSWTIQAKLNIYLWLGTIKHKKYFIDGLPKGYEISQELRNIENPKALPPTYIHYQEKHVFELRASIYQARSLIGSDASGLSDPFAKIIAGEYSKTTQVIDETLSPTWDELLIFEDLLIYGSGSDIEQNPPTIIIEIYDQDKVGKSEFIGRTMIKPLVKLGTEPYARPKFPAKLRWFDIVRGNDQAGELLAALELLEVPASLADEALPDVPHHQERYISKELDGKETVSILPVPQAVRPVLCKYRVEVLFWGLRDLKRVHLLTVDKPRVDVECSGKILYSSVIENAKKNPNFNVLVKYLDLELPEQELYRPPITIRVVDCRSFGRYTLVGTHIINSIHKYIVNRQVKETSEEDNAKQLKFNHHMPTDLEHFGMTRSEHSPLLSKSAILVVDYGTQENLGMRGKRTHGSKHDDADQVPEEEEDKDWWTKYFASIDVLMKEHLEIPKVYSSDSGIANHVGPNQKHQIKKLNRFAFKSTSAQSAAKKHAKKSEKKKQIPNSALSQIYTSELEHQTEFENFKDWLQTFDLYRGKKTGDEIEDNNRVVGQFKGAIKAYKFPNSKIDDTNFTGDPNYGLFQGTPSNDPIKVLVRVYVVKASDLHPMDLNGKADPYINIHLGNKHISDKDNYISKQLNPVFGKCFEIEATFPQDSLLTIQVYDWDLVGSDDMIGETKIDLENRFYSKHRATCGLALKYEENGYNTWRDSMKPTQILAKICKDGKVSAPIYAEGEVKIGLFSFNLDNSEVDLRSYRDLEERMALAVLHRWHEYPRIGCKLVPEHIETRSLYKNDKPGIEQGKIEMWVDMFPMDMPLPGPHIDISPRKPKSFELRVIIWNTDDVVLEDDAFFTGEKMSDIYVKGWLKGPEDCQCTDIHYRSLTGEGNFNWRFIFPFNYMVAERKIVITRKESLFSWDETESKIPARLELQVWDADHFSADDFLGAITLDLNKFPRGAKSSKLCTLEMLKSDSVPLVNIFKQRRVKGWWPFFIKRDNEDLELTGKVEAEIHLLTKEEAEKTLVGYGRNEPDALEKPNRPDASFMWFLNPIKSIRHIVWHNYKWTIIKLFVILVLSLTILLFFYSIPGYTVKKIIGA